MNKSLYLDNEKVGEIVNKCRYEKGKFVPCKVMAWALKVIDKGIDEVTTTICEACGGSLQKPEEEKIDIPWWSERFMLIQHKETGDVYTIDHIAENGIYVFEKGYLIDFARLIAAFKPIGGPFDMVPEWAAHIEFYDMDNQKSNWGGVFYHDNASCLYFPIWHNCPEEFKGKTFSLEGLK